MSQVELSAMMERKQHEITKNGREGLVSGGSNSFKLVKAGFLEEVALELTPGKQHTASQATTRGGAFQEENTVSAKALSQEHGWCSSVCRDWKPGLWGRRGLGEGKKGGRQELPCHGAGSLESHLDAAIPSKVRRLAA